MSLPLAWCLGMLAICIGIILVSDPPRVRRYNRRVRGVLPAPSDKCKRNSVEASP